jgi:hypothetical protein
MFDWKVLLLALSLDPLLEENIRRVLPITKAQLTITFPSDQPGSARGRDREARDYVSAWSTLATRRPVSA